jgi:hypothetical protein
MIVDHLEAIGYREDVLKKIFDGTETLPAQKLINSNEKRYDLAGKVIFNDSGWKGFFPVGQPLNAISIQINKTFRKRFFQEGDAIKGITNDSDFFIDAHNTIEEVTLDEAKGHLDAGKYIVLKYTDFQWKAFYDVFKVINDNLLIGKVCIGIFPHGKEIFTFPMVREYYFDEMTVEDHREIYEHLAVTPDPLSLEGSWLMSAVSNSNHRGDVAKLAFDRKPDGKIEGRYLFFHAVRGQMETSLGEEELKLIDFTPFHDQVKAVDANYMIGKWITSQKLPFGPFSAGLLQSEPSVDGGSHLGFYYTLKRCDAPQLPSQALLSCILERKLAGVGLRFHEQMDGRYYEGDLDRSPAHLLSLSTSAGVACRFEVTMNIADLDAFVSSEEHKTELTGIVEIGGFLGEHIEAPLEPGSYFNYLILNPETDEREMRYHIRFAHKGRVFVLDGTKLMQRDHKNNLREILEDYTTLFVQIREENSGAVQGSALMKFRTFESLAAVYSTLNFGLSFTVVGAHHPAQKAAAIAKFNAMTASFILDEYNPSGL